MGPTTLPSPKPTAAALATEQPGCCRQLVLARRRVASILPVPAGKRAQPPPPPSPCITLVAHSVVERFSEQHLEYWAADSQATWVLNTMSQGYRLQFRRRPPAPTGVRVTSVADLVRALRLSKETATFLDKKTITVVKPHTQSDGLYSTYFLFFMCNLLKPILDLTNCLGCIVQSTYFRLSLQESGLPP